jgi:uncharacterized protein YndB with AHSA1/START domain
MHHYAYLANEQEPMMTTTLHHAIKVAAFRPHVFKALAEAGEMAAWHVGGIEGKIAVGSTLYLNPKPGLRFGWKTDEVVINKRLRQTCVEGPGRSVGKIVTVALSDTGTGGTLVKLTDSGWTDGDAGLPFCNTHWGEVLLRLKEYAEKASSARPRTQPLGHDVNPHRG